MAIDPDLVGNRGALLVTVLSTWVTYLVGLAIYRLYLSPLARIPGPKLAALSKWYEFYYDVVLPGQFTFHIQELHKKYGPIVRITPVEVHIQDSSFFDELYRFGRRDKDPSVAGRFGNPGSVFVTPGHDLHRQRRASLNPMFSKKRILELEPMVISKVDKLCAKISEYREDGRIFPLDRAFVAFAADVIMEYSFSICYNHLDSPNFQESFHEGFVEGGKFGAVAIQFPLLFPIITSLPDTWVLKMQPVLQLFIRMRRDLEKHLSDLKNGKTEFSQEPRKVVFQEVIKSNLPPEEKTIERLGDEAQNLVAAGLETVAWALSVGSFHIINTPRILSKLRGELKEVYPNATDVPEWTKLERLPYLTACARESARLSYALSTRSARLNPDGPMIYKNYTIPKNTPVSMNVVDMAHDESIYPDSHSFLPERWLNDPKTPSGESLEHYFVAFGKGPRSCLGISLAYAELHLVLARLFRRFDFELYETDESDVRLAHDFFIPQPKADSKGVRVKVVADRAQR